MVVILTAVFWGVLAAKKHVVAAQDVSLSLHCQQNASNALCCEDHLLSATEVVTTTTVSVDTLYSGWGTSRPHHHMLQAFMAVDRLT